jgi:ribosomal protein S18 acetylase RimI-like enzyme
MSFYYLNKKFQQAKRYYRDFGFRKTLIKVIKVISSRIYTQNVNFILLKKDLTEKIKFTFNYKLEIQRIEKNHLGILKEFIEKYDENTGRTPFSRINASFENNYGGFIAFLQGEIIGYFWWVDNAMIARRNHPESVLFNNKLEDGDVYGFDFFIAPEYRGNSNAIEFLCKSCSFLNKLGYNRIFGVVAPNNTPARWLYKLFGYKDVRRIIERRFLYFVLFIGKTIFLKTSRWSLYYPWDYRAVYPFKDAKF